MRKEVKAASITTIVDAIACANGITLFHGSFAEEGAMFPPQEVFIPARDIRYLREFIASLPTEWAP